MSVRVFSGVGFVLVASIVAVAAVMLVRNPQQAGAAAYSPTLTAKYCNALAADFPTSIVFNDADLLGNPSCVDTPIPASTARDQTTELTLATGSYPGSPIITNAAGTVSADAAIPNGQKTGGVRADQTLSLLNGPCNTFLVLEFILYDAATSGAPLTVAAEGTMDRFSTLVTDANTDNMADANSPMITSNLDIYEELFTPTGGSYIVPLARYSGATRLAGSDWFILSLFQYSGATLSSFATNPSDLPSIFGRVGHSPASGVLSVHVEGDPTAGLPSPTPIHDYCSPQVLKTMLLGMTPGGQTRYLTPTSSTAGISTFSYGRRDADNDNIENELDTCPLTINTGSDADGDQLDAACDPTPGTNTNFSDHDGDTVQNRFDNCPLVANGGAGQIDGEILQTYISAAPDAGPKVDGIGDACDPNPLTSSTEGSAQEAINLAVKCIGGTDADGDGYCSTQDVNDANAGVVGFASNGGMDQDYLAGQHGDSFGSNTESYLGTDPLRNCASTGVPNDEVVDAAPADFDDDGAVDTSDLLALKPYFALSVPSAPARFDITPSKSINISDVLALVPLFNSACLAGSSPATNPGSPIANVALDTNTGGNAARVVGTIEDCLSTTTSTAFDVDLVIPSPGVSGANGLAGVEFHLLFDPAILRVDSVTYTPGSSYLLAAASGSAVVAVGSDATPDTDGDLEFRVVDFGDPGAEPGGVDELGPGVVLRLSLTAVGAGQSSLVLSDLNVYGSNQNLIEVTDVSGAGVAVNQACGPVDPADADGDGIEDVSDSDPLTPSSDFSDEHGGALPTTGSIVSTGGATVAVSDSPDGDPDESRRGVVVDVSGGGGPVVIDYCGETLILTPPASTILTCGSAWLWVEAGTATLDLGSFNGSIDAVAAARFSRSTPGVYDIYNHQLSQSSINIGGLLIAPNTLETDVKDTDADSLVDQVDNCPSVANLNQANVVHPGNPAGDACENPDSDNFVDATDNCPDTANNNQMNSDIDPQGDACDPCPTYPSFWPVPSGDTDCDGFTTSEEMSIGTNQTDPCGFIAGGMTPSEVWPPDFVPSNSINVQDPLAIRPFMQYGTMGFPPAPPRYDIVPSTVINIQDVLAIRPYIGDSCPP